MLAYKKKLTIRDPRKINLSRLPLHRGQRIEIVVMTEEDYDTLSVGDDLKKGLAELSAIECGEKKARPIRELFK